MNVHYRSLHVHLHPRANQPIDTDSEHIASDECYRNLYQPNPISIVLTIQNVSSYQGDTVVDDVNVTNSDPYVINTLKLNDPVYLENEGALDQDISYGSQF